MEVKEILDSWEKDCKIDIDKLDQESINIPLLHHKYLKMLSSVRVDYKKLDLQKKKLCQDLWIYYSGKSSPEVYKKQPLPGDLISNTKIKDYIETNEKYTQITQYMDNLNEKIDVLVEILKEVNGRAFKIKNAIDWQKFLNGSN